MSGYDYANRSGYAIHTSKPVSVVSYDGHGTRTYVTRIEERVEQVRRPSTRGYIYSSAIKAEKDSRPREVDEFITKLLDEVNGPSGTTTRRSDSGYDYKFGANPRSYYEVEYVYAGSPTGSQIPRNYGDPYDLKELGYHVDDNPSKSHYGGQDNPSDDSRVKSQTLRDYEVPKTQWERSSYPSYDASPYVPPPVESHASRAYDINPRAYDANPNNRLKSDRKDYGAPDRRWVDSSAEPLSPGAYERPGNHLSRSSKPTYDEPQPNSQMGKSPLKPEIGKGYGDSDNQWSKPLKLKYDEAVNGRSSSPEYEHPPRKEIISGAPNNQWGSSPLKASYDRSLPSIDHQRGDSSFKPQSPKGYGVSDSHKGRSSSPKYDPPQSKVLGEGSKSWGNSPLKPTFDQTPPDDNISGPSYGRQSSPSVKLQSPTVFGGPGNQRDGSTSPNVELPPRDGIMGRVSNNRLGNPPVETPKSPRKIGSSGGYQAPNDQKGRSNSPEFEHPPLNEIATPLRVQIPRDHDGDSNQVSLGRESPSPIGNVDGVANNRWNNISVKTQSPRDYGARGNQWSNPSSPVYNKPKGDLPNKDNRPNDFGGSDQIKSNGYQASPLSQRASEKPRDIIGDQKVSSGVSLQQPKYSVYSSPTSKLVTVRPTVIDSREAEMRYGHLDAPSGAYDQGEPIITSRDALKKYSGYFV